MIPQSIRLVFSLQNSWTVWHRGVQRRLFSSEGPAMALNLTGEGRGLKAGRDGSLGGFVSS